MNPADRATPEEPTPTPGRPPGPSRVLAQGTADYELAGKTWSSMADWMWGYITNAKELIDQTAALPGFGSPRLAEQWMDGFTEYLRPAFHEMLDRDRARGALPDEVLEVTSTHSAERLEAMRRVLLGTPGAPTLPPFRDLKDPWVDKNTPPDIPVGPLDWPNMAMWTWAFVTHAIALLEEAMRKQAFDRPDDVHLWLDSLRDHLQPAYRSLLARMQFAGEPIELTQPVPDGRRFTAADVHRCKPRMVLDSRNDQWFLVAGLDEDAGLVHSTGGWLIPVEKISKFSYSTNDVVGWSAAEPEPSVDAQKAFVPHTERAAELLNASAERVDASAADILAAARGFITLAEMELEANEAGAVICRVHACPADGTEVGETRLGPLAVSVPLCRKHSEELRRA